MRALVAPLDAAMNELDRALAADVDHDRSAAAEAVHAATRALATVLAAGALALLVAGVLLARSIRRSLAELGSESARLAGAVTRGELEARADEAAVAAEFRPILAGMNGTMDAFTRPLKLIGDHLDRISRGDLPPPVTERAEGQFDVSIQALNRSIAAVSRLVTDANALATAAVDGRLGERADAAQHQGEFRSIVEGLNRTLATVVLPLREVTEALEALAARDLRARIATEHPGDYAKLKVAFNATAQALHDALAQAAESSGQVASAANQIASASESVANGASEQASALEETAASLESMTSMTKQSADNAQQANTLALTAREAAGEGAAAMDQMAAAMGKIRSSADSTSQIIKDINEIAFQTNLLALNAAVEAARAGDAGRGFAVVAEEVRALALRSKEAAQKTEELIRESVRETEAGVGTARRVQEKLNEIQGSVAKVTDIVAEIAASAKEQAAGIDQVTRAVADMDKVTQQNAANSEESSSAASELSGQAAELASIVGAFQIERAADGVRAAAPPAAAVPARPTPTPARPMSAARARASAGNGAIALRPEDVIPLDDDASFQDF
jgi:methyl-accepting chemotaxis protein